MNRIEPNVVTQHFLNLVEDATHHVTLLSSIAETKILDYGLTDERTTTAIKYFHAQANSTKELFLSLQNTSKFVRDAPEPDKWQQRAKHIEELITELNEIIIEYILNS